MKSVLGFLFALISLLPAAEPSAKARVVIVFGDSITDGSMLAKDQRDQAWVRVAERESHGQLTVINEGKGGRPTDFRGGIPRDAEASAAGGSARHRAGHE